MSILVLQSSWWGRESWSLCFICLPGVSWWLSGSSSQCQGVVCSLWLWYFLIILTYYFPRWLFNAAPSLTSKWNDFSISVKPICLLSAIKFLLKMIYGLEDDDVWRIPGWKFSARQYLIRKWDDFSYFWVSIVPKPSTRFLLKRIYGLEDVGGRIPRWLFSARQSLVCKWDDVSYFWVSMLPEASHQVSAQEDIGLKVDVGWRIPRWLFNARLSLTSE